MKKIMNITTNGEDLLRFQSREDLKCYLKGFDLHGLEVLEAGDVEEMTAGKWNLTLFTCTYGGKKRLAVRCGKVCG